MRVVGLRVFFALALGMGALFGIPIDPEKIRELLSFAARAKQVEMKQDDGEDLEEYFRRRGLKSRGLNDGSTGSPTPD